MLFLLSHSPVRLHNPPLQTVLPLYPLQGMRWLQDNWYIFQVYLAYSHNQYIGQEWLPDQNPACQFRMLDHTYHPDKQLSLHSHSTH